MVLLIADLEGGAELGMLSGDISLRRCMSYGDFKLYMCEHNIFFGDWRA